MDPRPGSGVEVPQGRDPFIDLLRVVAIVVVVAGHWVTTTIVWSPELVTSVNALAIIPESRLVTWLVQVMPLVFFAGGFANAVSLAGAPDRVAYLQTRMRRLLTPTAMFLGMWLLIGLAIELTDPSGPGKVRAAETAALPLWFLGIYVVTVASAPVMWRLHRRAPWTAGVLAGGVIVVDVLVKAGGMDDLGGLNYALVWLFAHQLGFFYADGRLVRAGGRGAAAMVVSGLAALVVLVSVFGYPVSLVGVPEGIADNAEPPSFAMVAGTVWLVGLALMARPAAGRWLERPGVARRVARGHRLLLTVYLWHITALMVAAGLWRAGGLPEPDIGSASWWAFRPLWVLAALPPLALLAAVFGRFEVHPMLPRLGGGARPGAVAAAALGVFSVSVGLLGFGETGFLPLAPVDGEAVLMFDFNPVQNVVHLAVGVAVLGALGRRSWGGVAAIGGSLVFLGLGVGELAGWADRLGMNRASGIAHLVVGVLGLGGAAVGMLQIRRRVARESAA